MVNNIDFLGTVFNSSGDNSLKTIYKRIIFSEENSTNKLDEILVTTNLLPSDLDKKFFGYIYNKNFITTTSSKALLIELENCQNCFLEKDIVNISFLKDKVFIRRVFRNNSNDNILFLTNKCNSNCIFCPDPDEIRKNDREYVKDALDILELYPETIQHIGITGGEPTLLKDNFFYILSKCKNKFPNIEYTIISNGRMFFYIDFCYKYIESKPQNTTLAIPLHGYNEETHDKITRVNGSFRQTTIGLKNLLSLNEKIEIRIVLNKTNYKSLHKIIHLIIENFSSVKEVNILSLELLGNAGKNYKDFWIEKNEINSSLHVSIPLLIKNKIKVNLYNFPLCYLNSEFWALSRKSITDYKSKYGEECASCRKKPNCDGFFFSTYNLIKPILNPIK
ncbi:His-Xaa-Ser system radical SAM maturase HxsC [Fusobacterium varium]|uniref:His-Xaa-Ser system radical SAM maturase HxsC n=1 Tax=Fusobacterium varium TaxID=856 RepID=UPI003566302B